MFSGELDEIVHDANDSIPVVLGTSQGLRSGSRLAGSGAPSCSPLPALISEEETL